MKLFSLPDGTVDRKDRAQWLTCPFDLAFGFVSVVVPPIVDDAVNFTFTHADTIDFAFTRADALNFPFTQADAIAF